MNSYYFGLIIGGAILDIIANIFMKKSDGFRIKRYAIGALLMVFLAFTFLAQAIKEIDLAVAYASWGAIGILGTAFCGRYFFNQRLNGMGWLGIVVIIIAVVVLKTA